MRITKKLGVYSRQGAHPVAKAFMEGLRAVGQDGRHRSHSDYGVNDTEGFDAVVVFGLQGKGALILAEYTAKNVPVIVIDFGYVRRVNGPEDELTGHWQVSVGGLNRLPQFACPQDRFEALRVPIEPPIDGEGPAVLCVQRIGDTAHPFDTAAKLQKWIDSVKHDEVRGHPLDGAVEDLGSFLERCGKVVTWNSNIGHDALLAGVPVEALGEAPYAGISMDARAEYFARVAYGQWTADEMREGVAQRFLFDHLLPGVPLQISERTESELRTDGPTLEEYMAAGYNADSYPPQGYAARESAIPPEPPVAADVGASPQPKLPPRSGKRAR